MAGAHSVVTLRLQQFRFTHLGAIDGGGTKQAIVVVDTAATQFCRLAIEQEPFIGRKRYGTDAKWYCQGIVLARGSM